MLVRSPSYGRTAVVGDFDHLEVCPAVYGPTSGTRPLRDRRDAVLRPTASRWTCSGPPPAPMVVVWCLAGIFTAAAASITATYVASFSCSRRCARSSPTPFRERSGPDHRAMYHLFLFFMTRIHRHGPVVPRPVAGRMPRRRCGAAFVHEAVSGVLRVVPRRPAQLARRRGPSPPSRLLDAQSDAVVELPSPGLSALGALRYARSSASRVFAGVTAPLLSNFVPPLCSTRSSKPNGDRAVMAIYNVLLLARAVAAGLRSGSARGRGRLHLVLVCFLLAAAGMALFPAAPAFGLGASSPRCRLYSASTSALASMLCGRSGPSPTVAANASVTFQMCAGAIVFLRWAGCWHSALSRRRRHRAVHIGGARIRSSATAGRQRDRVRGDVSLARPGGLVSRARHGPWPPDHLHCDVPAAAHLSVVHDVVRAARHRALRRAAGRRDDRLHRLGDGG